MHADTHHIRNVFVAILLALLALGLLARPAHSAWGGNAAQVHDIIPVGSRSLTR